MIVYWFFLIWSLVILSISKNRNFIDAVNVNTITIYDNRGTIGLGIAFFFPICILCGLRSGIADTGTYIMMFRSYPDSVSQALSNIEIVGEKGFYLLSVIYKQIISKDYHGWLFVICLASCIATMKGFLKYSTDYGLTCFLFIATTFFTWLLNGMRQFVVISVIFAASNLIVEKKYLKFIVLIILLSTIHKSALIFIPVVFLINSTPWSWKIGLTVFISLVLGLNNRLFNDVLAMSIGSTQYSDYVNYIASSGVGVNLFRFLVNAVPVGLAFYERDIIENENSPMVNMAVNMSTINICIYFVALFTSGMAMGRLAAYFEIYNLILLPWVINHSRLSSVLRRLMILFYILFFYVQMQIAWKMGYESDILHLFIW